MSNGLLPGVPDLRARVLRGLVWVGASQVGAQLTRAVVAIVIARLLTPEEYGLAALALVFASLVMVFSDLALGAALIQRKDAERGRPRHGVLDDAGRRRRSSRSLGVALSGPIAVALRRAGRRSRCCSVLSLSFVVSRARGHAAVR